MSVWIVLSQIICFRLRCLHNNFLLRYHLNVWSIRLHVNIAPIWFCNICYSVAFSEKSERWREKIGCRILSFSANGNYRGQKWPLHWAPTSRISSVNVCVVSLSCLMAVSFRESIHARKCYIASLFPGTSHILSSAQPPLPISPL